MQTPADWSSKTPLAATMTIIQYYKFCVRVHKGCHVPCLTRTPFSSSYRNMTTTVTKKKVLVVAGVFDSRNLLVGAYKWVSE